MPQPRYQRKPLEHVPNYEQQPLAVQSRHDKQQKLFPNPPWHLRCYGILGTRHHPPYFARSSARTSLWLSISFFLHIAELVSSHRPPEDDHGIHHLAALAAFSPHAESINRHAAEDVGRSQGAVHKDDLSDQHSQSHSHQWRRDSSQQQFSFMQALQRVQSLSATNVWQHLQKQARAVLRSDVSVPTPAWYALLLCVMLLVLWANLHRCLSTALQHLIEEHDEE
eukprot:1817922-Amphidinium_carterae.1